MYDDAGVHDFCRHIRGRVVGTLVLVLGDAGLAEELAQETLARVWLHWPTIAGLDDAARDAWTYRVALNLARSWLRRRIAERRAVRRLDSRAETVHVDPDVADAIAVRQALAALPRRQRTALVLRYYTDLPIAEVAAVMGCAPGTVKALTSQGLRSLRGLALVERGA
jgi:RNA polymerase sigma factor (sigma-70 family)